jgi:hypothetical protein
LPLVIPQQVHVAHIGQLTIYCRCEAKSGIYFLFFAAAPGNRKQNILLHFFDHEHFDGFAARNKFKAELVEDYPLQTVRITEIVMSGAIPFHFVIPCEINVETTGKPGSVNDWNL